MNHDLDTLLTDPELSEKLKSYVHISPEEYTTIPPSSFITYIDRDGRMKVGGYFVRFYDARRPDEKRFLLSLNGRLYSLNPFFYHIFYKPKETYVYGKKKVNKVINSKTINVILNKKNK